MNNNYPKSLTFSKKESNINLIINGQGVFIFENHDNNKDCCFRIYNNSQTDGLQIKFTINSVLVNYLRDNEPLIDPTNISGLSNKEGVYYWFSIDYQNQRLYAGIGEARIANLIYKHQFDQTKLNKSFLESLISINIPKIGFIKPLKLLRDPITENIPLLIKDTQKLTMDDIAKNTYLPTAHLSSVARQLYDCISGEKFELDTVEFPDFSKAIEYSIATPGCWCYEKIKDKSTEFNPDEPNILETYLRITLGQNNGESPGIPYVMEIWPPNHYSPIHNHAGSNAVIRVLYGNINVSLFSFLCTDPEGIEACCTHNFVKNNITWISPTLNQVHQLKNVDPVKTCITIQCYMYDGDNGTHYDYFDYIDNDGNKQQYEPDSDMDFVKFKQLIKQEWDNRPKLESEPELTKLSWIEYLRQLFC